MKQLNAVSLRVVFIAIGVVLPAVAFLWLHLAGPSDGTRLEPGLAVWRSDGVALTPLRVQASGLRRLLSRPEVGVKRAILAKP